MRLFEWPGAGEQLGFRDSSRDIHSTPTDGRDLLLVRPGHFETAFPSLTLRPRAASAAESVQPELSITEECKDA